MDPAIEIVSVCTPPSTHGELTLAILAAGKHAVVEKPLVGSLAADEEVVASSPVPVQHVLQQSDRGGVPGRFQRFTV